MDGSNSKFKRVMSQLDAKIETVVGFDDDSRTLVEQLMGGKKKLQIMSVVGMAGIGKTTLVKKVFNEPSIVYHFHVRAWTTVTQKPNKRDLLLGILKTCFNAEIEDCSDMELSQTLKRRLSGQRYMIVMDDIWNGKDWDDLMLCFPDDNVGSRIVFTSRIADLPLLVQTGCYQHSLHLLTEEESWDLLRYKVFLEQSCPPFLIEIGKYIARKCQGLPLSLVVIAGTLASDTTSTWWSQVAQDMSSIASNARDPYLETLVLSYNHLPFHLKPCFLYFIAFPEDYEIPAWKLIMLWVAEGFIETTEKNLEEVAAGYLEDLISRSMVIVSQRRSNGGIKACIIHDALRDLCTNEVVKVKSLYQLPRYQQAVSKSNTSTKSMARTLYSREVGEENLLWQLKRYSNFYGSTPKVHKLWMRILSSYKRTKNITLYPNVQSILCFSGLGNSFAKVRYWNEHPTGVYDMHRFDVLMVFKSLKVLDLSGIELSEIPNVIKSLQELRYIAVCAKAPDNYIGDKPYHFFPRMDGFKYIETVIIHNRSRSEIYVNLEVWMFYSLRHLILRGNTTNYVEIPREYLQIISYLQTLSFPFALKDCENILKITANLRKLRINAALYVSSTKLVIPGLNTLQNLENLSLQNDLRESVPFKYKLSYRELSSPSMFPETLKKLTLVCTFLKWTEMETIGKLPNLEVLKLQCEAFRGEHWETNDDGFRRLRYLAFKFMKIVQWSAYSDQFPNLQHLKLDECLQLEEIPISIGDIYTLEMIEIRNCSSSVVQSAREIKEDQLNKGNDMLKISIFQT